MTRLIASFAIIASTSLHSIAQNFTDPNPPTVNELKLLPPESHFLNPSSHFTGLPNLYKRYYRGLDGFSWTHPNALSGNGLAVSIRRKQPKYRLGSEKEAMLPAVLEIG